MSIYVIRNPTVYDIQKEAWVIKDVWIDGNFFSDKRNIQTDEQNIKVIDASGKILLPGIVDLHNDEFEKIFSPKRNVFFLGSDLLDKLMLGYYANGITSANIAVSYSIEPGIRNADKAITILQEIKEYKKKFRFHSNLKVNLRVEMSADWSNLFNVIDQYLEEIAIVTLCDHSPNNMQNWSIHKYNRYISERSKMTNSEFTSLITQIELNKKKNSNSIHALLCELKKKKIVVGIHDMCCTTEYDANIDFGEFPTSTELIDYLHKENKYVVLGTPNIRNGGSINNNISCLDACKHDKCDILCSDYDRNSVLPSVSILNPALDTGFYKCFKRLSENPARLLGIKKGVISPGYDADCILINRDFINPHICKTFVMGELAYESFF